LGIAGEGALLTVVHTYRQLDDDTVLVRIISARKATDNEIGQHQEVNQRKRNMIFQRASGANFTGQTQSLVSPFTSNRTLLIL
jgi:hypothetical protein